MQPIFTGSHRALDFLNTSFSPNGVEIEAIGDGSAFLTWLVAAELLDASTAAKLSRRFGVKALEAAAAEAREVREWARDWLIRWREHPQGKYEDEIKQLNKLLSRDPHRREVSRTAAGFELVDVPHLETANSLLSPVIVQLAALITREDPTLIRDCAASDCTLWFLDRTKAHRRLFCSASACGNRAKVAAFRNRQRAE